MFTLWFIYKVCLMTYNLSVFCILLVLNANVSNGYEPLSHAVVIFTDFISFQATFPDTSTRPLTTAS